MWAVPPGHRLKFHKGPFSAVILKTYSVIPALRRLRLEDQELESGLGAWLKW
jgi:hypothetical protein